MVFHGLRLAEKLMAEAHVTEVGSDRGLQCEPTGCLAKRRGNPASVSEMLESTTWLKLGQMMYNIVKCKVLNQILKHLETYRNIL